MNNTNVIIIGVSHHNTYSMVRCYGERGVKSIVILYGSKDSYILHSKYISESFVTIDEKASVDLLLSNRDKWNGNLIISCTDAIASCMDMNYDLLKGFYHFFNCGETGLLTKYMNKFVQTDYAREAGFDVPQSVEGLVDDVTNCLIPYPRIIKPVESIHGGKHIAICQTDDEFKKKINAFAKEDKIIVQQFVLKDRELVIVGLTVDDKIIIPGYIHKHRDEKGGTTYSTVKPIEFLPSEVVDECKKLVLRFSYQGLFGIELIVQGDRFFFIEMNLRNDATTYALAKAGVNLPLLLLQGFSDSKLIDVSMHVNEITSMVEFPDFIHVLRRNVTPLKWYRQMKKSGCRYFYSDDDKEPYRVHKKEFVRFIIKRILKG